MEFKPGDKVLVVNSTNHRAVGKVGKIISNIQDSTVACHVEFNEDIHGHSCSGLTKRGYGWNIPKYNLKLVNQGIDDYVDSAIEETYGLF